MTGVVLDPYITLSGSATNYTFSYGTTYYIPTSFSLGPGSATFSNSACLKFGQNASLLTYGSVSFPSYGAQIVFTSKDDNAYGAVIAGSTSEPGYAATKELWMYYQTVPTVVQTVLFRWAQQGIRYDENNGVQNSPSLASCVFQNCATGVYQNTPNDTLYLSNDTYCNVVTPLSTYSGGVSGSLTNNCGTATVSGLVDASKLTGVEGEPSIAVNPVNPLNLFMAANHCPDGNGLNCTIYGARSIDGGTTWTASTLPGSSVV